MLLSLCLSTTIGFFIILLIWEFRYVPFVKKKKNLTKKSLGHQKFDSKLLPSKIDAIVIGSGMGGLTCASTLAHMGKKVVVLEAHEVTGGGTHSFVVNGKKNWQFDSGLHYTIPQSEHMLQIAAGAAVPPVRVIRMADKDNKGQYERVKLSGPINKEKKEKNDHEEEEDEDLMIENEYQLLATLKKRFPELIKEIDNYNNICKSVLIRFPFWVASALLPFWLRKIFLESFLMTPFRFWSSKTAEEGLNEIIPSQTKQANKLKGYLCGLWIDTCSPPERMSFFMQAAVSLGFPHEGGAYPAGGAQAMNYALVESIESHDGCVFVRSPVASIIVDDDEKKQGSGGGRVSGVRLVDGTILHSECVVSATGYRRTMSTLVSSEVKKKWGINDEALTIPQAYSFVMANVAIEGNAHDLGLKCQNLWVQPIDEKGDVFQGVRNYFAEPLKCDPLHIPLMFTFPSIKDRSLTPTTTAAATTTSEKQEFETLQILALADFEWFRAHMGENPWARNAPPNVPRKDPEGYADLKNLWRERLEKVLYHHYPQLEGKIAFMDISTPLTVEHYLPSFGAAISLDVTPDRFVNMSQLEILDMKSKIPGLFLTGQDTIICGIPLAQSSGLITAARILGPFGTLRLGIRALRLLAQRSFIK